MPSKPAAREPRTAFQQAAAVKSMEDMPLESLLLLAERLWCHSDEETPIKQAAGALLLAGLQGVLLADTDDQGVVDHAGDVGDLRGVQLLAACIRCRNLRRSLGQLKPGGFRENSHGSVPSKEGSDKSAPGGEIPGGRRLSNRRANQRKARS
jgi:hypothetical protein